MPPACTRNRVVLYGVPWLAVALTVVIVLLFPTATSNSLAVWCLAGSIFFVGLPHGAADWWLLKRMAPGWMATSGRHWFGLAAQPPEMLGRFAAPDTNGARRLPSTPGLLLLGVLYTLAALLTLALWSWQPGWSLAAFLALTAWHFGSAEASVLLLDRVPMRDPVWWLFGVGRGLLVVSAPLAFRPAQSALVLLPFVNLGGNTTDVIHGVLRAAPSLLWWGAGLQTLGLCLEIRRQSARADQRSLAFEGLETGVLLLLFQAVPPLLAFVCYWMGFHAWRHLLRLEDFLHPAPRLPLWRAVIDFHRRTLPLTLLSLLGFGIIRLVWPASFHDLAHGTTAYLILLSALTVPHALVIGALDEETARVKMQEAMFRNPGNALDRTR